MYNQMFKGLSIDNLMWLELSQDLRQKAIALEAGLPYRRNEFEELVGQALQAYENYVNDVPFHQA